VAFLARFRRSHSEEETPKPLKRRRYLPPPSRLRRERRALVAYREQRIRDLGGLVVEMYRQDRVRQDLIVEQAAEIVSVEARLREVDRLLGARTGRLDRGFRCSRCGTPLHVGARFCPSCGQALARAARA
jgi:rubrerythrin